MLSFWGILGQVAVNSHERLLSLDMSGYPGNSLGSKRLVMTLLVRNEADVIEGNLRFHLDHGVDFIVVTDNGSSDGTTEILEEYAKKGVVHLIHESSRIFQQCTWVNNMGALAYSAFAADMIFHADADELWHPASGSLKTELYLNSQVDVLSVPVRNMLTANKGGNERFPEDVVYEVANPIIKSVHKVMNEVGWRSFLLYRYPNKVIYKTRQGYLEVVQGNHDIQPRYWQKYNKKSSCDIEILHFPVRGFEQFCRKIINNGEGLENLEQRFGSKPIHAWHVKRWYALYKSGGLDEEYQRLLNLEAYLDKGVLSPLSQQRLQVLSYFENFADVLAE
ncbi:MAG: glycosyltransferase family 2 protein [Methylovulum sp.]|uniref:glycosyltransferase family 2 protein n=1 Tax=Methylovulum sp. TaxID=1916980 RepID=UPI00262363E8|nr:glycosyltransferase family 2 protein [Methylovulum sp.]MDD2724970.1 glycosyltransferase family 2 protein [Methylovulum sp.]MDD5123506.1 glycosyltransferase family 2 protein [Methylovulum sp.]